jgi:hypothetical protein
MDVQKDTQFSENRIQTFIVDSTNSDDVKQIMDSINIKFDIIIDDGWHYCEAQKKTLVNFFPFLKENGLYIIEDIYPGSSITSSHPRVIRDLIGSYEHFFVGLKNNQCVIRKKLINSDGNC